MEMKGEETERDTIDDVISDAPWHSPPSIGH